MSEWNKENIYEVREDFMVENENKYKEYVFFKNIF